ncbi:MAG: hypothetical protein LC114_02515 [Bryobacterales bacterium]|nr:hypothetical protein [Bryobacterales bacterium]
MALRQITQIEKSAGAATRQPTSDDLVMAWAVDCDTAEPRYILQLDEAHRGARSNCKCPSCGLPLQAVNAAKLEFKKRPHFRHPEGAAREQCLIVAARRALADMFGKQEQIVLPRRRRSKSVEGLSGRYFDAWVELPPETVGISHCAFHDATTAILTLDDGRRLVVQLMGYGEVSKLDGDDALLARIEIDADDPIVAGMSPEEIFTHLELAWANSCWIKHWSDAEMEREAEAQARSAAADALDWLDADDLPSELTSAERRETLLHREVKAILERERRIRLPGLHVDAQWRRSDGFMDTRTWSEPEMEVALSSVDIEVHLGSSIPDVIASWTDEDRWDHSIIIEITVTNPIKEERIIRLSAFGFPVLEIDIGRMGGIVTREEFTRMVVDEVAGKRWLFHPTLIEEHGSLIYDMKREEAQSVEANRRKQFLRDTPASDWASRFLDAFHRRWRETPENGDGYPVSAAWDAANKEVSYAVEALVAHGYPASGLDMFPLQLVVARILSIKLGIGVNYKFGNAWGVINAIRCDRDIALRWHTLYLIAVRVYQPFVTSDQLEKVHAWRDEVVASIKAGETQYVRDTVYDRLIGLLFPEMCVALANPFGTPLYIADEDFEEPPPMGPSAIPAIQRGGEEGLFLRGREFEEWARRNPEAAKAWMESPAYKRHQSGAQESEYQGYKPWKSRGS